MSVARYSDRVLYHVSSAFESVLRDNQFYIDSANTDEVVYYNPIVGVYAKFYTSDNSYQVVELSTNRAARRWTFWRFRINSDAVHVIASARLGADPVKLDGMLKDAIKTQKEKE